MSDNDLIVHVVGDKFYLVYEGKYFCFALKYNRGWLTGKFLETAPLKTRH